MQAIIAPDSCPSCGSALEWRSDLLYCNNDLCGAKVSKRLEHWGKTLKIKGLGPRTIEKLEVENLYELYDLTQEKIIEKLLKDNFNRTDCIIALDGGVIGDLSAFIANLTKRGIK